MTTKERYLELVEMLNAHNHAYYVLDQPVISDREYDRLYKELEAIEKAHPELKVPYSPSLRVGGEPLVEFKKVTRSEKMMSLDNTYNIEDLAEFLNRVHDGLHDKSVEFIVEPKVDGLAVECIFEDGQLVLGATRGNGLVGEDITENIKTIRNLPLRLQEAPKGLITVRGEIYLDPKDLMSINQERTRENLPAFKNPRNAAAGSVRLLDSKVTAKRPLKAIFYQILHAENWVASHKESLDLLKNWGLLSHRKTDTFYTMEELKEIISYWEINRTELDFEMDGLVLKVNPFTSQKSLGQTSKYPRWAISYKFETEKALSQVYNIRVQVGRTGAITPVAELEPVELAGTTVSNASLHNADEIKRLGVKVGDYVWVEKAGEIIPKVIRVESSKRTGKEKPFKFPERCPSCKSQLGKKSEEDVAIRCLNSLGCPAQKKEAIRYFASRSAANIEHVGPALIDQMVDQGLISDAADLFYLKKEELLELERMGEKSADNVLASLEKVKGGLGLDRFLVGLGIPMVGNVAAEDLAKHAGSVEYFVTTDSAELVKELEAIHGLGEKMAKEVSEFFKSPIHRALIKKFLKAGIHPSFEIQKRSGALVDKSFCITGVLSRSRDEFKDLIRENGGSFSSSVTKKTDYLIAGEKVGANKLESAKRKGVEILNESQFFTLIGS